MNIHRYLLPATIAATVHVALLWFLPGEDYVRIVAIRPVSQGEVDPPIKNEPVPVEEKSPEIAPVKTLAGGPTPPEIDEPPVSRLKDAITIPADERYNNPSRELKLVPEKFGPGDLEGIGEIGLSGPDIFTIDKLDHAPRAKVQLPPEYPPAMRHDSLGGSVLVEFDVNAEGRVVRAEAIRCSNREFAEAAVRAVRKWQFEPGRRHNRAVPFRMTVPIEFGLENN
jgi:protein TonB